MESKPSCLLKDQIRKTKLSLDQTQLQELREKHGTNIETWWQENFGHAFDCLTQSEARYLARTSDVDTIRDRIAEAK